MADNLQATPRNQLLGLLSDAMYGGLDWMKSPERTQQMQGLAGLLESTGIPQTTQRMAYGEPLTNIGRANVPLLKPETAEAMMNVAPFAPAMGRVAGRAIRATEGLPVGMSIKDVGVKYPQQAALDLAQQRAALPVSEGGLGLPPNNTAMDRAKAMAGLTKENAMSQAHNIGELEFLAIPNQQFKGKLLYQSPSYSGKKGSVYKLGTINDEPAYLRQSDHFGGFATNLIEGSPEFKAIEEIQKLETGDIFGRVGKTTNQWNLKGGKAELKSQEIENALQEWRNSATDSNPLGSDKLFDKYLKLKKTGKETGAIPLSELVGRLPEKKYSVISETGERFEVPMIRMPDGSFRSRFAAFDPFRKDVATATAMGVALPDLLAAEPTPQSQSSGLLYPFP